MGIMNILQDKNNIIISGITDFCLSRTLDCGQCFRWNRNEDDSYTGVAFSKALTIKQYDDTLCFYDTTPEDFHNIWYKYFDFERDYNGIIKTLSSDPVIKTASSYGNGIHLLRQEAWETIISFIISASNNIPRIKKIIELLCSSFGSPITYMGQTYYTFPTPEQLSGITVSDLEVIRAGFRDKYIVDAVNKVNSGLINLEALINLDMVSAKEQLLTINGIGNKVADCILLFGLQHYECFPVDVWIKRIIEHFYFDGKQNIKDVNLFAREKFESLGGFAQQYLFFYARETKLK